MFVKSRRIFTVALALLAVIVVVQPVEAQTQAGSPPSIQGLVQTPQYQANIARLFSALPPDVFQRCPSLISRGSSVTVIQTATFAPDGYPVIGIWKQSFPVAGCGNDTTINFFFRAQGNEKITSMVAAPGDTHADFTLQSDAVRYALMEVRPKSKDCSDVHLRTTSFEAQFAKQNDIYGSGFQAKAAGWREIWTFAACGQLFNVELFFRPDVTGTNIEAAPAKLITK